MAENKEKIINNRKISNILNDKFKILKEEIIKTQQEKLQNLVSIKKELSLLENSIDSLNKIDLKEIEQLQKPLKDKIIESISLFYSDFKNFNFKNIFFGRDIGNLDIDEFGKDANFINKTQPLIDYLYDKYWRVEVKGENNLNLDDNFILVANHGGILPWDSIIITEAVRRHHSKANAPRFLIEDWFIKKPFVSIYLSKLGICRGSRENAERLLKKGEIIGLFPEGIKGAIKPFNERYHIQRFGRGGAVKTAITNRKKVIPVAVIGSDEIYPTLTTLMLESRLINIPYFPITPSFPIAGPLGLLPLPVKWYLYFGEPIDYDKLPLNTVDDDIAINSLNEELRSSIQGMVSDIIKNRRSLFFG